MSNDLYRDLLWLPPSPDDFLAKCRAISKSDDNSGERVQTLATCRLTENQLARLAAVISMRRERGSSLSPLTPFRLGVISNANYHFVLPALVASAARHAISLECVAGRFDQATQDALVPGSLVDSAELDAVLVALDYRGLPLQSAPGAVAAEHEAVATTLDWLLRIRSAVKATGKAVCILQTVARVPEGHFGSLDLVIPGTHRSTVDAVNRAIANSISGSGDLLLDVAGLAETVGLADWHDPRLWDLAKLPFSNAFIPLYADHISRTIAALCGKSRRCLILDLDNTLWSGTIGDDGLEGIVLGQGDPVGEGHLRLQESALALRDRGIVLAVSSKNIDEIARLPFQRHPDMRLRESHFAAFRANWSDKASNIKAIAQELSLSLDSIVFLDDNPAERKLVRDLLPQVAVPELPDDPALYARVLLASGHFEAVTFSDEDRRRAKYYQDDVRRTALRSNANDIEAYLTSLKMVLTISPFDQIGRNRIVQLINKSNQFNLTTRRYTEPEVEAIERDENCFALQVRLTDLFGDSGMIGVVICSRIGQDWTIDSWVMSCRILGRCVENAILHELLKAARHRGVTALIGVYRPTSRNKLVEDHYGKLGFTFVERRSDATTVWQLSCEQVPGESVPIEIRYPDGEWPRCEESET